LIKFELNLHDNVANDMFFFILVFETIRENVLYLLINQVCDYMIMRVFCCFYIVLPFLAHLVKGQVSFLYHLSSDIRLYLCHSKVGRDEH